MKYIVQGKEYEPEDIVLFIRAGWKRCGHEEHRLEQHLHASVEITIRFVPTNEVLSEETQDAPQIYYDEADALEYATGWAQDIIEKMEAKGAVNYMYTVNPN